MPTLGMKFKLNNRYLNSNAILTNNEQPANKLVLDPSTVLLN